ncbi:MAG: tRNA dihydrouridine synthase DusB [Acidimicrobiales bacterium]
MTTLRDPASAAPGEFTALHIGPIEVWPPVVLAPMAGVTDLPFRRLCRTHGAGLYVNQMITARGWLERDPKTLKLAEFGPDETPRSIQLYGTDPRDVGEAAQRLVEADGVDHIDMNFGCPVPKVTRHGGGAALPYRRDLLRAIVRAAVNGAGEVPVTIKFRIGIDDEIVTYLDTARIAQDEGCAAVSLHARTAEQLYSGSADWSAVARLVEAVDIPVLGNGDVFEASDALAMMRTTGCAGVVVGRGCLGRPWLFARLAAAFEGQEPPPLPTFGEVAATMLDHVRLLVEWQGSEGAVRVFRKHALWYLVGFPIGGDVRNRVARVSSVAELEGLLGDIDPTIPFPLEVLRTPRSHTGGPKQVSLPDRYLEDPGATDPLPEAAGAYASGG